MLEGFAHSYTQNGAGGWVFGVGRGENLLDLLWISCYFWCWICEDVC